MTRMEKYLSRHVTSAHVHRVLQYIAIACCPARSRSTLTLRDAHYEAVEFMKIHIAENRSVPNRPITHLKITTRDRYELESAMQHAADTLAEWYRSNPALGKKR